MFDLGSVSKVKKKKSPVGGSWIGARREPSGFGVTPLFPFPASPFKFSRLNFTEDKSDRLLIFKRLPSTGQRRENAFRGFFGKTSGRHKNFLSALKSTYYFHRPNRGTSVKPETTFCPKSGTNFGQFQSPPARKGRPWPAGHPARRADGERPDCRDEIECSREDVGRHASAVRFSAGPGRVVFTSDRASRTSSRSDCF
jgi:hypothetical protein